MARMTAPTLWQQRPILEWPEKQTLFKSWILLFGVLPIDRHSFYFDKVDPASGFSEQSSSLTNANWCHTRQVLPSPMGCQVIDKLDYESRLPLLGSLMKPIYQLVFWIRHRNLRARYGGHKKPLQ
ncbi:MAG: hypothetical protein R3352_01285 [Salinisphaeraceae bacterium]|nr:hypothetical protein [Salinisphaeraceae bacterium]